jgi:hypothetical protein
VLEVNHNSIPAELQRLNQWTCWKYEYQGEKLRKVPINPKTRGNAMSTNKATWSTFEDAWKLYEEGEYAGLQLALTPGDPYLGVDLDKCIDTETGKVEEWAQKLIERLNSYTEISPSGTGIRIFVKAKFPGEKSGLKKDKVEFYDRSRFFTVTGKHLAGTPTKVESRQEAIDSLWNELKPPPLPPPTPATPTNLVDQELLALAMQSKNGAKFEHLWAGDWQGAGYPSQSEADLALCMCLAFWTGKDLPRMEQLFRSSGLYRQKWDRDDYRLETLHKAIARTVDVYTPPREQKSKASTALPPLKKEPILFPELVKDGVAGEFAKLYGSCLECPEEFLFISFLTCFGSIVADRLTIESQVEPQPRLYSLLLGESADVRKSTAIKQTCDFFVSAVENFSVCYGVGSAEGLQKRLEEKSSLVLCFDEFKQFVSKCKIEASVLLPCVNTLFESNRYESRTKHSDIKLSGAHLCILAASTVDTYANTWSSQFTDIGFNNRLFIVPGSTTRRFSIPPKIDHSKEYRLKMSMGEMLRRVPEHGLEMRINPKAQETFHGWYMALESSVHTKRLDTYALRLMPLLAINLGKDEVDEQVIEHVTSLCDWQLGVRRLYDPIDAENNIARMEEKIRRALSGRGPLSERNLKRFTNANRVGLWVYRQAIGNLRRGREVQSHKKEGTYYLLES